MRQSDHSAGRLPSEWLNAVQAAQKRSPTERSSPIELVDRTKNEAPASYEHSSELQTLIGRLKRERIRKELSLGDVARLTQQARSAISRLENGGYGNPTLNTLYRYAHALGWHITLSAEPLTDDQGTKNAARKPGRE